MLLWAMSIFFVICYITIFFGSVTTIGHFEFVIQMFLLALVGGLTSNKKSFFFVAKQKESEDGKVNYRVNIGGLSINCPFLKKKSINNPKFFRCNFVNVPIKKFWTKFFWPTRAPACQQMDRWSLNWLCVCHNLQLFIKALHWSCPILFVVQLLDSYLQLRLVGTHSTTPIFLWLSWWISVDDLI